MNTNVVQLDNCRECHKLGKSCIHGFFNLPAHEILEKCKQRRIERHVSIAKLAEDTHVPEGTVARLFSGNANDPKYDTLVPIAKYLFPEVFESCDCAEHDAVTETALREEVAHLRQENERLHAELEKADQIRRQDIAEARADSQQTINFLKSELANRDVLIKRRGDFMAEKDAIIKEKDEEIEALEAEREKDRKRKKMLSWIVAGVLLVLLICAVITIILLIRDYNDPNSGHFWLDRLANVFGQASHSFTVTPL